MNFICCCQKHEFCSKEMQQTHTFVVVTVTHYTAYKNKNFPPEGRFVTVRGSRNSPFTEKLHEFTCHYSVVGAARRKICQQMPARFGLLRKWV